MSVTSGGTAPNGLRAGGRSSAFAGSAGIVITLSARQLPFSRLHRHTEADRSSVLTTTPTKPQVASGSCDGRSSRAIWCCAPRSTVCWSLPAARSQKCSRCPYFWPSSSSGLTPSSIIGGVPGVGERAAAGVPPEMVQLVSAGRQVGPADDLAVLGRLRVGVEHGERVRLLRGAVEDDHVGELLGRGADGVRGAPVEGRVDVVACGMTHEFLLVEISLVIR